MKYDFDKVIDRRGTETVKYGACKEIFGREDVTPLWVADMDFEVCPEISEQIANRISHKVYGYAMPSDSYWDSIIQWQATRYGFRFTREELTYIPGVVKGIALVVNYFTQKGDKVVIQEPVYHPFKMVINGNGRVSVNNALVEQPDGSYRMNLDNLEHIFVTEKPKMMILCNPHNPIGIAWDKETLIAVARLAKRYGVIVVSDEIHGDLALYDNVHYAFATVSDDAAQVAITLGAPSKTFNIAGLVSSWCVIKNKTLRKGFYEWLEANEFNASTFIATIATQAAYNHGTEWLEQMKRYLEGNIEFVINFLQKNVPQIKAVRPEASFLVWLDCRPMGMTQAQLNDFFCNKVLLGMNSGDMFGEAGTGFMRFNIGTSRIVLAQALARLEAALKEKQG